MLAICALVWSSLLSSTSAARQASMLLPNDGDDMDAYLTVTTRVPVIGVISQTREPIFPGNVSYFAASYVQYAEMAGARVVPVLCDQSKEELTELFGKLNGLIVPGLQSHFCCSAQHPYLRARELILQSPHRSRCRATN